MRDLTFTDELAVLEQIKNKPHNNSQCQLVEVIGVLKFAIVQVIQDRLCGLVVRVPGYRSGGPGSIPGTTRKKK
jgi:hypothetical protein